MNIEKYVKLKNGMYNVFIDGEKYKIHEDLILKYNFLINKMIDQDTLYDILSENKKYESYNIALKEIKRKLRTKGEIKKILTKHNIDDDTISEVISLLSGQGYLNDDYFVDSYIHDKIVLTSLGPLKIKRELINLGINEDLIERKISIYDYQTEVQHAEKIVDKFLKTNKKSVTMFRIKMKNHLSDLGYHNEVIYKVLESINFNDSDNRKKEYDKLYKKYSKKYDGAELEYKIKQALYQKGF